MRMDFKYVVLVDNEVVAKFSGLCEYSLNQRLSAASDYAERLKIPAERVSVYNARHFMPKWSMEA